MTGIGDDPFPLIEETTDPAELPTVSDWLSAGAPMREGAMLPHPSGREGEIHGPIYCDHDGWVAGCPVCEANERAARKAMGECLRRRLTITAGNGRMGETTEPEGGSDDRAGTNRGAAQCARIHISRAHELELR